MSCPLIPLTEASSNVGVDDMATAEALAGALIFVQQPQNRCSQHGWRSSNVSRRRKQVEMEAHAREARQRQREKTPRTREASLPRSHPLRNPLLHRPLFFLFLRHPPACFPHPTCQSPRRSFHERRRTRPLEPPGWSLNPNPSSNPNPTPTPEPSTS